MSHHCKFRRA
jgi:hypothetical protein